MFGFIGQRKLNLGQSLVMIYSRWSNRLLYWRQIMALTD